MVRHDDVLAYRHGPKNRGFLEGTHHAFARHDMRRQITDALAAQTHFAGTGLHKRGNQLKQRGFTCPIGPDDRENFALLNRKTHVIDRHQAAVALGHALDLQDGAHGLAPLRSIRLSTPLGSHSIKAIIRLE